FNATSSAANSMSCPAAVMRIRTGHLSPSTRRQSSYVSTAGTSPIPDFNAKLARYSNPEHFSYHRISAPPPLFAVTPTRYQPRPVLSQVRPNLIRILQRILPDGRRVLHLQHRYPILHVPALHQHLRRLPQSVLLAPPFHRRSHQQRA